MYHVMPSVKYCVQANDLFEMMGTVFVNNTSLKTLSLDNVGMRGYVHLC